MTDIINPYNDKQEVSQENSPLTEAKFHEIVDGALLPAIQQMIRLELRWFAEEKTLQKCIAALTSGKKMKAEEITNIEGIIRDIADRYGEYVGFTADGMLAAVLKENTERANREVANDA